MIRQALDTLPNCLPSSKTPTLVLITLSAVVISPRFLPAVSAALRTYEDLITIVRFSLSTYSKSHVSAARVISFNGGRVVVERQNNLDHVTVTDNVGKLQSE